MPNYKKRGLWLRAVADRLEDPAIAGLLDDCANRMMDRAARNSGILIEGRVAEKPVKTAETA